MSKLADRFRSIKIFNNHGLLTRFGGPSDVAIEYERPAEGRAGWGDVHQSLVWSPYPSNKLDAPERMRRFPEKRFMGLRAKSYQQATNWAMAEFRHEYVSSPFGGRVPKHVMTKALAALKTAMGTEE